MTLDAEAAMRSARFFIPALLLFVSSRAVTGQTERPTVRITTSYTMPESVPPDTGRLTQTFVAALGDSLVRILPSLSSANGSVEPTQFVVALSAMAVRSSCILRVRVMNVASARVVFQDGLTSTAPDSVATDLQRLAQRVTGYLVRAP